MNKKFVLIGMVFMIFMLCFSNVAIAVAPVQSNEFPNDDGTMWDVPTATWNVTITDIDSNFNWTIDTQPNVGNSSAYNTTNGSKTCSLTGLSYSTTYRVYVNSSNNDSSAWTNASYNFTTKDPKLRENPAFNNVEKALIGLMGVIILIAIAMLVYKESQKKGGDLVKPLVAMLLVIIFIGIIFSVL